MPNIYDPHVRIPSNTLRFSIGCVSEFVDVELRNAYAVARNIRAESNSVKDGEARLPIAVEMSQISKKGEPLKIRLTTNVETAKKIFLSNSNSEIIYTIVFDRIPNLDVHSISLTQSNDSRKCEKMEIFGSDLIKVIDGDQVVLMHYKLIQEGVSDFIYKFNNAAANVVLCIMIGSFFWIFWLLSIGFIKLYARKDSQLKIDFKKRFDAAPNLLKKDGYEGFLRWEYTLLFRRLSFARAAGPTVGFLLTVSSLSAALHPSAQANQDTFFVVNGIHIGLVATFIGLAIRIAAQFAQRFHRELAEKYLSVI